MGKNKQLKKLRKLADQLPELERDGKAYIIVTGVEAFKDLGLEKIDGKPVVPSEKYKIPVPQKVNINHSRFIKKSFQRDGKAGVKAYIAGVNRYAQQLKEKYEKEKNTETETGGLVEQAPDAMAGGVLDPDTESGPLGAVQRAEEPDDQAGEHAAPAAG